MDIASPVWYSAVRKRREGEATYRMHEEKVSVDIPWLRRWDEPSTEVPDDSIDYMNMLEELEFK